ncbi:succinate--CoA ligase subunit alpha [Desulfoscipio geothermicus]|uniref:Succinyl-CoA synthetase (ADP-forming) alpha subunit n=1 Tax=Desulfoscipio geothermicus DSM 3669 TaxID=1121426 RepID=A0A1I6DZB6_9FIRM|nr:succinate--CoA ligase subunit alpha [Desulfoscipio geothermicus]SFR10672.1 succinyl-CoA synthetase (ADP-forming) alpha subunit [Desulfoscipio geothermicus DSM 3669]
MAILVNPDTRVIIQGITGKQGTYHALKMLEYNVHVVGGVTPGKGGQKVHGVTVYDTVAAAKKEHQVDASMIMVPPAGVLSAAIEAIDNKIPLIVIITEFVPVHDSLVIRNMARKAGVRVIGPNTIGVISPGKGKVGIMPGYIYSEGSVGIISRSGTLTHEVSSNLTYKGIGQSTCVCIGGDPVKGTDFVDALHLFRDDDQTETVVMIGEIGGAGEELAAKYVIENGYPKKIVAFIAGQTAPAGKKMGHAGAIVSEGFGTAESKIKSLGEAGITVVRTLDELLQAVQ